MSNLKDWQVEALRLKNLGFSGRKIALALDKPKSTVSDFFKRVHDKDINITVKHKITDNKPKILLYDIETAPIVGYVWGRFKQFLQQPNIIQESFMLTFAYKWLGDDTVRYECVTVDECFNQDDSRITELLHKLISEADIVIAHNLKGFDHKIANTRFLKNGLTPPAYSRKVDTLEIAKKNFRFPSNKLNDIGVFLELGEKMQHEGLEMWVKFLNGDEEARETMCQYNVQDVFLLEDIYLALRAWDSKAPNVAQYYPDTNTRCPCCGSTDLTLVDKKVPTAVNLFKQYKCNGCGKHSRSRKSVFTREKTASILANCMD